MFAEHKRKSSLDRLTKEWIRFRDIVLTNAGQTNVSQVQEEKFLEQKGRIAKHLSEVHSLFPSSYIREASLNQKGMLEFLGQHTSLRRIAATRESQDAFEAAWQRYYLALNHMKGAIGEQAKEAKAHIPDAPGAKRDWTRVTDNWFFRLMVVTVVVVASTWVLANILPWEKMGWEPELAGLKTAATDATGYIQDQAGTVDNRVQGGVGGLRSFLQPVIDQWGPEATAIMCTVLLLIFGYWIFIRTR
ncbi:MAG: hypothetical protein DRP71_15995 [Verrucomicrobia bacterium]|nr:MAG: hypothetical protein DRP71_15995 [Verrucomicrobiota bacterium]